MSIAYDRVLSISSEFGSKICGCFLLEGVFCPLKLKGELFTTAEVDNRYYKLHDSCHGTGISLFQHQYSDVPGVQRIVNTDNTATTVSTVTDLPESHQRASRASEET